MAVIFKKLKYKNFLSTGNQYTEIDLTRNRTTLIVGENGSGKSTILDALTFALFGKPYRPINIPQLLNSITKKNLEVEIEFTVGSLEYKITRGLKPHIFEIYKNNELINKSANNKDYQSTLETQILKVNFKSFCQVVVLGSATFKPFMQLSAYERREVIEDLLDLQIFTSMNSLLKNRIMMNGHRNNEALSNKKTVEDKIQIIKDHLLELQNSNEEFLLEKTERIQKCSDDLKEIEDKILIKEKFRDDVELSLNNHNKIKKRYKQLTDLKYEIEFNRDNTTKDIDFYNKNDNCPTCQQIIDNEFKSLRLEDNNKKLETLLNGLSKLEDSIKDCEEIISQDETSKSVLSQTKIELVELKTKAKSLVNYRDELQKEIEKSQIKNKTADNSKLLELEKDFKSAEKELSDTNSEKELLLTASSLLKDSGIKAKIVKQYVPIINKLINKYLSALDFFVQFELNEEFKEKIKSRYRDEFSYASFSEGEKLRINLAILFTWRAVSKLRNSMNTNLLIMDEIMDSSLDGSGVEEFLRLLSNITLDTNTFIISHKKDQLLEKFEHVIKFEKKQNFSRIS
jgi:DNA repair exonuclease SbcCD ATPase subunit